VRGNLNPPASDQVASFVLKNGPPVTPSDVTDSKFIKDVEKNEETSQSSSSTNQPTVLEELQKPEDSNPGVNFTNIFL